MSALRDKYELQARCSAAIGLLAAAADLVAAAGREGPKGNPFGNSLASINRSLNNAQQLYLALYDENEP